MSKALIMRQRRAVLALSTAGALAGAKPGGHQPSRRGGPAASDIQCHRGHLQPVRRRHHRLRFLGRCDASL